MGMKQNAEIDAHIDGERLGNFAYYVEFLIQPVDGYNYGKVTGHFLGEFLTNITNEWI
jgi:hypothetical protein